MLREALLVTLACGCGRLAFDGVEPVVESTSVDAGGDPIDDVDEPKLVIEPVAHFPMDALAGTTIADASRRGHDASCIAGTCPTVARGRIGSALAWNGNDTVARVAFAPDIAGLDGYTVAAWVSVAGLPDAAQRFGCVFSKLLGSGEANSWQICVQDDGKLNAFSVARDGARDEAITPAPIELDAWHHIAVSWDGSAKTIWLDGAPVVTHAVAIDFDRGDVVIGGDIDGGLQRNAFRGLIDDLRIYDRALTATQIAELATAQ